MKKSLAFLFAPRLQTRHRRRCLASGFKVAISNLRWWEASTVAVIGVTLCGTLWVKVKVKFTLVQATKYQRGSRCIALLFLYHGTRSVWVVSVTPRPLLPTGKIQYRRLGGPQGQSGQGRNFSPRPEFVPPTVGTKTKSHPNETPLQATSISIYTRHMLPSTWHKCNV